MTKMRNHADKDARDEHGEEGVFEPAIRTVRRAPTIVDANRGRKIAVKSEGWVPKRGC